MHNFSYKLYVVLVTTKKNDPTFRLFVVDISVRRGVGPKSDLRLREAGRRRSGPGGGSTWQNGSHRPGNYLAPFKHSRSWARIFGGPKFFGFVGQPGLGMSGVSKGGELSEQAVGVLSLPTISNSNTTIKLSYRVTKRYLIEGNYVSGEW